MTERASVIAAAALLVASLSLAAAQDTASVNSQTQFNTSGGTIYNKTGTLSPLHFNLYGIPVPQGAGNPDILLTLNATTGGTGLNLYCNPGFGAYADPAGNYPSPGYAVWSSDLSTTINQIFISKNDDQYKSPTANSTDAPFFICSVINSDANTTTNYTLSASIVADNRTLVQSEQDALASLFNKCCTGVGTCSAWKNQNSGFLNANGGSIDTDFCNFPGQICNPSGNLFRLNLASFNLSCPWPGAILSQFPDLATLNLGSNLNVTGSITDVMGTVANLTRLQFLDISANTGITGTIDSGKVNDDLCAVVKRGLVMLGFEGVGLGGTIPSCIFASGSTLLRAELGYNNFTGTLPDAFAVNSSLQLLHVHNNLLTGKLPVTLSNAVDLVELDTSQNMIVGTIPAGIGSIRTLQSFVVKYNNLTGPIPDSFGTAPNLATFDVKQNFLTKLPAAWSNASYNAVNSSLVNVRASFNNISGPFPSGLVAAQQLTYLVLNVNNFSGPLPTNVSMFPGLRALNMSSNALTGTIPSQFGQSGIFTANPLYLTSGLPLGQVFDLSYNKLVGSLPSFLTKAAVPIWTQGGIFLEGNSLTVNCSTSADFYYITSVCPNGNSTVVSTQRPSAAPPAQAPAVLPHTVAGTPPAPQGASVSSGGVISVPTPSTVTTAATPARPTTVQTQSITENKPKSSSGLSGGAVAGIVIGIIAAVCVAVFIGFFAFRRRSQPMMPKMRTAFGMPSFGDGEFGRKSSLTKGLTTLSSAHSGFERFNDVELSPPQHK